MSAPLLAALFELDGVLFDLGAARAAAVRDGLAGQGVHLEAAASGRAAGLTDEEAAVRSAIAEAVARGDPAAARVDDVALALAVHRAERAFGERLRHGGAVLTPGAREAVDALGARLRLGVVTHLRRADAEWLLDAAGVRAAFAVVVATDDRTGARAASGGRWAAALARLAPRAPGLAPARAAAIVATSAAVAEARAAGLRTVFVEPAAEAPGRGEGATRSAAPAPHGEPRAPSPDVPLEAPTGADVRLRTLSGLAPAALACALDLAPASCTAPPA